MDCLKERYIIDVNCKALSLLHNLNARAKVVYFTSSTNDTQIAKNVKVTIYLKNHECLFAFRKIHRRFRRIYITVFSGTQSCNFFYDQIGSR